MKLSKFKFFTLTAISVFIISLCYSNVKQDDAYIFFTYAKNISEGNGYVFNSGEKINATTSPLYTLLVTSLNFVTGKTNIEKIPIIGYSIGVLSLLVLVFYCFSILEISRHKIASYIFPLLLLANPLIRNSSGMETYFALMLSILVVYYYLSNKYELATLFAGLAILARYDSFLLVLIILLHYIVSNKKFPPYRTFLIFFSIIVPWFLFSYFYFGNFLPSTFKIKIYQQTLGYWGKGLLFIKGFVTAVPGGIPVFVLALFIFSAALVYIFFNNREIIKENYFRIILFWTILYFIIYGFILNPPPYPWYYTIFCIPFGLVLSIAIESILKNVSARYHFILILFLFWCGLILPIRTYLEPVTPKYSAYYKTAKYLNSIAPENSSVAIDEIGILGFYYEKGRIIDLLGLVNPQAINFLKDKNYLGMIDYYKPDYLVIDYPRRPLYENFVGDRDFANKYSRISIISGSGKSVEIFQKKDLKPK